ncbi:MAG: methylase [Actinomycetia bacterium]|nr:methylase [Actinomycetes bacterium]
MEDTTVTAADIARLAGVGRAAVSNWRRRHPDFPPPVGGTPASPVFSLAAIEAWLRDQGKLQELTLEERVWQQVRVAGDDLHLPAVLADVGDVLLEHRTAGDPLTLAITELAAERGAEGAFEFLFGRYLETQSRRVAVVPPEIADLMAELAGDAETVFDPACGTGGLLLAALARGPRRLLGQDTDDASARLTAIRLALRGGRPAIRPGDSLLADAFPGATADAVLCDPPFHERNWGYEELTADPRWEYGLPPRMEPELAWVQHALAHLAPGGCAIVLMPSAAASRRPGRRIRAQLLRKGALRAVIAVSPTHHLWVLHRPVGGGAPVSVLMVADTDRDGAAATWRAFQNDPGHDEPGVSRAVPIIDLLDEEVDLTPARHLSTAGTGHSAERFVQTKDRLAVVLAKLGGLVPRVESGVAPPVGEVPVTSVSELARIGALAIHQAPLRKEADVDSEAGEPLLTTEDVVEGRPPSGRVLPDAARWIVTRTGDVVVTVVASRFAARVMEQDGALLGPQLSLVRVDPAVLDPHFLAGVLRSSANVRSATSLSTGSRVDMRRAQVPRLPLEEQRRYGDAFRRMAEFETALRGTVVLTQEMTQLLADGVAEGALKPSDP